ncbi:AsmA protein [Klebsiella pneumoniae]|nr:AsmA protein [Klebsiella pneumoniae]
MRFNVRVLGGWKGEGKLIDRLKQTAIPLRIYGEWQSLSYSLQVDQILRKQLQDEAKQRLNDWVSVIKAAKTATMPKSYSISCNSHPRGPEVSGLRAYRQRLM